jgi:chitinase
LSDTATVSSFYEDGSHMLRKLWIGIIVMLAGIPAAEPDVAWSDDVVEGGRNPPKVGFHVAGYVPEYRIANLDPGVGAILTDLICFSAEPSPSGELVRDRLKPDDIKKLRAVKDEHGVALSLCVGGWGRSNNFAAVAAQKTSRERFAEAATGFCLDNHFDGIDIDWEHPATQSEQRNYGKLLAALKQRFSARRLTLTIAVAGWQPLSAETIAAVDRIHLMAYDGPGRHSTFDFAVADVARLERAGVPRSKICLGLPFYGRDLKNPDRSLTYSEILAKYHPNPETDEVDGMYFNGVRTVERKVRYAMSTGLAGVMIWELGQDAPGQQSLLRVVHAATTNTTARR